MSDSAGGFVPPQLLSPPPSSASGSRTGSLLPRPRSHPLRPGGTKESSIIFTIDQRILHISRSFANKQAAPTLREHFKHGFQGYGSFKQAGSDISRVIDLVWVTGTPSLQIAYLIHLAVLVLTYVPSLPPSPRSMFRVLNKLDYAFASLLRGVDLESGESLPGITPGTPSPTEKVRIKGLVERTRIVVVQMMNAKDFEVRDGDDENAETSQTEDEPFDVDAADGTYDMDVARIYDRTLVELGDTIGGPEIGIVRE